MKKMRIVQATKCEDALRDINPTRSPHGIPTQRWAMGMPRGRRESKSLGWYRGHQAGIYDAYLTVKTKYPRVAEELRRAFGMEKNGSYLL